MRKEERARHANTSASSFQPKQNPQQTEPVRNETGIEAEASEGQVAGKALRTGASGSFRGRVALGGGGQWWGGPISHQGLPSSVPTWAEVQENGDAHSTWSLLLLLQDPLRYQLFPKPPDPASGLGWAPHRSWRKLRKYCGAKLI